MCYQTVYQHQCSHVAHGALSTCGTPSVLGHHTSRIVLSHPSPCYTCSSRTSYPALSPYTTPAVIPVPEPLPLQTSIVPSIAIASFPPPYPQPSHYSQLYPPTYPPQQPFFQAGNVPASLPREVRYEMIRGTLVPVEHFRAADIGMDRVRGWNPTHGYHNGASVPVTSNRGWNPIHGFDAGAPPPGIGSPAHAPVPQLTFGNNSAIPAQIHGIQNLAQAAPRDLASGAEETRANDPLIPESSAATRVVDEASEPAWEPLSISRSVATAQSVISDISTSSNMATTGSEVPSLSEGDNTEGPSDANSQPAKKAKKVGFADNIVST